LDIDDSFTPATAGILQYSITGFSKSLNTLII